MQTQEYTVGELKARFSVVLGQLKQGRKIIYGGDYNDNRCKNNRRFSSGCKNI